MADGIFPNLVSATRDSNLVTNPIFVRLTDGTNNFPAGGGTEALALRVTIANDSTGLLSIDDNGGSITVDGTVAATQSGTWVLGANSGVDIGDVTINNAAGAAAVNIQDGGNSITIDGTVTADTNFDYAVDSVAGGTDVGALVLAVRDDVLATLTPIDGDYVQVRTDSTGALWVHPTVSGDQSNVIIDDTAFTPATSTVGAAGFLADETAPDSVDEGDIGAARMTLDRKQLMVIVDKTTDANRLVVNTDGSVNVNLVNAAITGEVHNYDTAAAVPSDSTDNHDYAVTGTTFLLKSVIFSGSGSVKVEIQTGPVAGLATRAVAFLTDRQGDTKQLFFDPPIEVPATSTGTVRVIRTNRQGAATDVYSTIIGNEI